ncbi:MAG: hypothetical protein Q8P55_00935 [bacterium]|nr:hypothetical protein [bacterium]
MQIKRAMVSTFKEGGVFLYPRFFLHQESDALPFADLLKGYGFFVRVGKEAVLGEVALYHYSERRIWTGEEVKGKVAWASHKLVHVCPEELLATPFLAEFYQRSVDEGTKRALVGGIQRILFWVPEESPTFWGGIPTDSCRKRMLAEWLPLAQKGYQAAQSFARNGELLRVTNVYWRMEHDIRSSTFL